ncbi:MAG TPA: isoprenylcysteine carboxylmethyltransferase family protein [Terracidiphilus sp.]|nr:isoprenylcysteine carboxylmethyltransferase family protein [Terracidiphilus sp.]
MTIDLKSLVGWPWAALGLVWLVGLMTTKRTVRSQSAGSRVFQLLVFALGFTLMGGRWLESGWLGTRVAPNLPWFAAAGLALTVAGCAFAIWARVALGGNWSGRATVKQDHELITTGPYALARHPIYTGIALALLGTALAGGEWRHVLGFLAVLFGMMAKMSQEERLMMQTFPEAYPVYRRRVKALIPGVL